MNRLLFSISVLLSGLSMNLKAQDVYINEAVVVAGTGAHVVTAGNILIYNNASIQNSGIIRLGGDWINNASGLVAALPGSVEFNGVSAQSVGGNNVTNFSYLNINNSAGVNLAVNANVSGLLTFFSGKINTGPNFMNMNTGPMIPISGANTGSYVNGNLVMNFPAGSYTWKYEIGNTVYAPAVFRVNGFASGAGVLGFTVAGDGPHENVPFANASLIDPFAKVSQYWAFESTPALFNDFEVEFDFNYTVNNGDPQQYTARRYTSASLWNNTTGSLTAPLKYKVTALPDLGEFVIGEVTSTGLPDDQPAGFTFNNPFTDQLQISFSGQQTIQNIVITDLHGRDIHHTGSVHADKLVLDTKHFASGMYFLTVHLQDGSKICRKSLKQ